jgi:hypothetical protein
MIMSDVSIKPLTLIGKDERGETSSFSIRDTPNFIYITRKKGSLSGNTYHEGKSKFTNPKIFVLLSGKIKLRYRHIEEEQHSEVEIAEPSTISISPKVTHSIEAVEDFCILECNSIEDIQEDRIRENVILEKVSA